MELIAALETDAKTVTDASDAIENFARVSVVFARKTEDMGDELPCLLRPDVGEEGLALNHGEQTVQHIAAAVIGHCVWFQHSV